LIYNQLKDSLDGLVMHFSGLDVSRDRVGQVSQLSDIGGSSYVKALAVIVQRWVGGSQRRWKAAVHGRIHELCTLSEQNLAEVVEAETRLLHSIGHSHSLEVATMVHCASFPVNERVVCG